MVVVSHLVIDLQDFSFMVLWKILENLDWITGGRIKRHEEVLEC